MPDTAVGSANGKSTIASRRRLPGNVYRTSIQATAKPKKAFSKAAANEAPRLRRNAASARGPLTVSQRCSHGAVAVLTNNADSGTRTIRPRYSSVYPSVKPKPGRTLRRLHRMTIANSRFALRPWPHLPNA